MNYCLEPANCVNGTAYTFVEQLKPYIGQVVLRLGYEANRAVGIAFPSCITVLTGVIGMGQRSASELENPLLVKQSGVRRFKGRDVVIAYIHFFSLAVQLGVTIPCTVFTVPMRSFKTFQGKTFELATGFPCNFTEEPKDRELYMFQYSMSYIQNALISGVNASLKKSGASIGGTSIAISLVLTISTLARAFFDGKMSRKDLLNLALFITMFSFGVFECVKSSHIDFSGRMNTGFNNCFNQSLTFQPLQPNR